MVAANNTKPVASSNYSSKSGIFVDDGYIWPCEFSMPYKKLQEHMTWLFKMVRKGKYGSVVL